VIDLPWNMAAGADFGFPGVTAKKAFGTDFLNWYVSHVQRRINHDPAVYGAFLQVMNMLKPPTSLFHPRVVWRVLWSRPRTQASFATRGAAANASLLRSEQRVDERSRSRAGEQQQEAEEQQQRYDW
jgi:hypothetical protein